MRTFRKLLHSLFSFFGHFHTECPRCHGWFFSFQAYEEQVKIGKQNYRYVCHRCVEAQAKLAAGEQNTCATIQ
jgi:hypothetical protein